MEIALIGLGVMGSGLARNLIRGGFRLRVCDASTKALAAFEGLDCRRASSPGEAAAGAQVVMTMLPDSPQVETVLLGLNGACDVLEPGGLVIDMSTIAANASDRIGDAVTARGLRFIDAPIGRTPHDAAAGTSLIIAGGEPDDVAKALPLFECLGDKIVHAGRRGTGIRLKLVNNYMSTVGTVLAAEALTLANKLGLDRSLTVDVLSNTTAGRGQLIVNYPKKVLAGDLDPDFPLRMAHKDLSHALSLGAEAGMPLLLGAVARETFNLAKPWGRENEDWTAMLLLLEDLSRAEHLPPIFEAQA